MNVQEQGALMLNSPDEFAVLGTTKRIETKHEKFSQGRILLLLSSNWYCYYEAEDQEIRRRWDDRFGHANLDAVTPRGNRAEPCISCRYLIETMRVRRATRALVAEVG